MSDSIAENKSLKAGDGEPNPTQKRTIDSKVPNSTANKKSKTENDENPEVVGSENAGSEVENDKPVSREMGFEIEADAAEDKGSRHSMEDAWVVLLDAALDYPSKLRCAHFAIYDGHGGRLAAEYAQKHLHANVLSAGLPRELVFVANIGDAKAVVARSSTSEGSQHNPDGATTMKAIVLTREHKAIYPQERARIQKAGGIVSANGRLQGRLEVSRAFGDRQFKKVGVVATPDIHSFDLTDREHFLILGCDGLWGVFGPSDAVDFVHKLLKEGLPVATVSRRLVREAVLERRCKDNCTAILIVFRHK
ncbi:probable protein phosphatase 2C 8 isoform X4 [Morus notabilis]|uniref:probable protein phosphatase 2C 8 isoform X4 n=1 Tax=Morus notabilis TaxID=981085 RepID=UPI000CED6999|nr:probable protein phosphatase 2C 8 isoform X4 [Morus notabilis]